MFTWPQRAFIRTSSTNILSLMMTTNNFFSTWITITHSYLTGESNYPGKYFSHTGQEILAILTGCSFPPYFFYNLTLCFPPLICFKWFPALLDWYEWSSTTFLFRQPHVPLDSPHFYSYPEGDTWSLKPATTTVYQSLFHHQTLLQDGIWHLSYVFLSPQIHLCSVPSPTSTF